MEVFNINVPRLSFVDKFLYGAIVPANACTKFQLLIFINFGDMEGPQNKNWGLLISTDAT